MRAVLGAALALALLLLVGVGTSWFGLAVDRPMQKYQEETRKEVYDTSRQFQQGRPVSDRSCGGKRQGRQGDFGCNTVEVIREGSGQQVCGTRPPQSPFYLPFSRFR